LYKEHPELADLPDPDGREPGTVSLDGLAEKGKELGKDDPNVDRLLQGGNVPDDLAAESGNSTEETNGATQPPGDVPPDWERDRKQEEHLQHIGEDEDVGHPRRMWKPEDKTKVVLDGWVDALEEPDKTIIQRYREGVPQSQISQHPNVRRAQSTVSNTIQRGISYLKARAHLQPVPQAQYSLESAIRGTLG
jgi:hypothetical protein